MAKVKIQGHASGTGVLTVTAPNTSTDRTITLPDATGTLLNSDGDGSSLTGITHIDATKLPLAGGEMTGNVGRADNIHSRWGTGNDLDIYHDGSHSYVKDNGSGMLILDTNGDRVRIQADGSEELANFNKNGSVELFYDNTSKFETTDAGIKITGSLLHSNVIEASSGISTSTKTIETITISSTGNASDFGDRTLDAKGSQACANSKA